MHVGDSRDAKGHYGVQDPWTLRVVSAPRGAGAEAEPVQACTRMMLRQPGSALIALVVATGCAAALVALRANAGGRQDILASSRGLGSAQTNPAASSLLDVGIAVHEAAVDVADARQGAQDAVNVGVDVEGLARRRLQAGNRAIASPTTMLTGAKKPAGRSNLHAQSKLPFGSDTFPVGFVDRWPPLMASPSEVAAVEDSEDRARDITPQKVSDDERDVARARGDQREGREGPVGRNGRGRAGDSGDAVFETQVSAARHLETLSEAMTGLDKALLAVRRQQTSRARRHATKPHGGGLRLLPAWSDLVGRAPSWDAGLTPRLAGVQGAQGQASPAPASPGGREGEGEGAKAEGGQDKQGEAEAKAKNAVAEAKDKTEAARRAVRAAMAVFKSAGCDGGSDTSRMSQGGREALPGCALSVTGRDVRRAQVPVLAAAAPCSQPAPPKARCASSIEGVEYTRPSCVCASS